MTDVADYLSGSDLQIRSYIESRDSVDELRGILEYESRNDGRRWVIRKAKMRMRQVRDYDLLEQ